MEKIFKRIVNGPVKAFRQLIMDLQDLEENGIMYKSELVPVRLQFLLGDNLGTAVEILSQCENKNLPL